MTYIISVDHLVDDLVNKSIARNSNCVQSCTRNYVVL